MSHGRHGASRRLSYLKLIDIDGWSFTEDREKAMNRLAEMEVSDMSLI